MASINNMKTVVIIGLMIMIFPVAGYTGGTEDMTVKVKSYSRASGKNIYLKDIADITGPETLKKRLEEQIISESPLPGRERRLPGSLILSRIKSIVKIEEMKPNTCVIPDFVIVERAATEITESELKKIFYDSIKKKVGGRTFTIRDVSIRGDRFVPAGEKDLSIDDRGLSKLSGRVSVTVLARLKDERSRRIVISGWIDLFDQVVCAGKDIHRGEKLNKGDLEMSEQNLSKSPPGILMSMDQVEGNIAKTRIEKGSCIRDTMIAEPPLIKKGNIVKIVAKSGLLTVVATGISKGDGKLGEQIVVQNTRSKKDVTAKVMNAETVEVVF